MSGDSFGVKGQESGGFKAREYTLGSDLNEVRRWSWNLLGYLVDNFEHV